MDTHETTPRRSPLGGGTSSILQFLSLYLLVLAFFIVLASISTFERIKSNAVMDSLSSTFASVLPPSTQLTAFTSKSGSILAAQEFQQEIDRLFSTALGVIKVDIVQPGRLMRVVMATDGLFFPGEARVRDAQIDLLDRLVATLSSRPPGLVYDAEFVIGAPVADDRTLAVDQTLPMARMGVLARELLARGAPPDVFSIGMRPLTRQEIVMWFYVRHTEEAERLIRRLLGQTGAP